MAGIRHQTLGSPDSGINADGARKRRRIESHEDGESTDNADLNTDEEDQSVDNDDSYSDDGNPDDDNLNQDEDDSGADDASDSVSNDNHKPGPQKQSQKAALKSFPQIASRIKPRKQSNNVNNVTITPFTNPEIANGKIVDSNSSFATVSVAPWLLMSLVAMEIKRPTAIQKACIPEILAGKDVIGGSKTGSGKTVAFAVPMLQKLAEDPCGIFGLVLTPTRELALQIYEQFMAIASRFPLKAALVTGGTEMRVQAIALSKRPHIVIATPGRLADHIRTSGQDTVIGLKKVKILVLDEGDRLLAEDAGMMPDVATCLGALPPKEARQTCLFTATMTQEVRDIKDLPRSEGMHPISVCEVDLGDPMAVPEQLHLSFLEVNDINREAWLHVLLQTPRSQAQKSIIVFANRTSTANVLERLLRGLDHRVTSLHSKLPQSERTANLARFRAAAARILIATDVASRGLDIPEVGLVINYDVPASADDYIHRVGRTARAGRKGEAVTVVGQRDWQRVKAIEERIGREMVEYEEEGVNIRSRVEKGDALKDVGQKKVEVRIGIEEGRDIKGNRTRGKIRRLE